LRRVANTKPSRYGGQATKEKYAMQRVVMIRWLEELPTEAD
jgi:hypothetical protein